MITFTSKRTHPLSTMLHRPDRRRLALSARIGVRQTATSTRRRCRCESNRARQGCQAGVVPSLIVLERTRCQSPGSEIDAGRVAPNPCLR
jgi:hypothetical protein